ncbi:MAG: hypothetical protein P8J37_01275 [Fuerstiella sp.]|nr:hypothetical protein [Fuerstiella sp.]
MRSLRSLVLAFSLVFLPMLAGCGADVETGTAVDDTTEGEDSTSGMTEGEVEEFEEGEGGEE